MRPELFGQRSYDISLADEEFTRGAAPTTKALKTNKVRIGGLLFTAECTTGCRNGFFKDFFLRLPVRWGDGPETFLNIN